MRTLYGIVFVVLAMAGTSCGNASATSSSRSASPVGHRWIVENQTGIICYDSAHDLEKARSMGRNFESITPDGFHFTGDESAGGRLGQGDIISIDSAGQNYYIVTPVRALMVLEGKPCAVDIATLQLSAHNVDAKRLATWTVGSVYKAINEIGPCFSTYSLAEKQYDAEVKNVGFGNGNLSLNLNDTPDDPARFRLRRIRPEVLTFYVLRGDPDRTVNGRVIMRSPHTGQTIYCAHENEPHQG